MTRDSYRNKVNKALHALPTFGDDIPLGDIFEAVESFGGMPVQEDGTRWSGFLCGETGTANIRIVHADFPRKDFYLRVSWYQIRPGRWETTAYIS